MSRWTLLCLVAVLTWTASFVRVAYSDVYTSSRKIADMVLQEEQILNNLQAAVTDLGNETASSFFTAFYQDRMLKVQERRNDAGLLGYLKHPNGVYHSIKQFATEYQNIRSVLESIPSSSVQNYLSSIADQKDIAGAKLSFLRLQAVYSLNASDMVRGQYLGFVGPELDDIDALEIGQAAFNDGRLDEAFSWLQEALSLSNRKEPTAGFANTEISMPQTGRILALLGRAYVRKGNQEKAAEMYRKAQSFDPADAQVIELERELNLRPKFINPADDLCENYKRLCQLQNKLTQNKFDPRLNCSYRAGVLPYVRFKLELVSVSPYVALFYDVISDFEGETIMTLARKELRRGLVQNYGLTVTSEIRTSDTYWLYDIYSPTVKRMSQRFAAITNLDTTEHEPGTSFSCEPFQVVNYGMGGHYGTHHDAYDDESRQIEVKDIRIKHGGNRQATFLIYLTDVERGGSTVFPTVDIAVSPVKNMGLFWYSYTPSGEMDMETTHGACPVVIGHKWVTNKWMWLHGNTFTRRCGLTEKATQLDIDQDMRRGWV